MNLQILSNDLKRHEANIKKQMVIEHIKCDNSTGGSMFYAGFSQVDQCPLFYDKKEAAFTFHCVNQFQYAKKMLVALGYKIVE